MQVQVQDPRCPGGCPAVWPGHCPQPGRGGNSRQQGMHGAAGLARGSRQLGPVPGELGHGLSGQYLQQHGAGITGVRPVQDRGHWHDRGDGRRRCQLGIDNRRPAHSQHTVPGTPGRAGITAELSQ